MSTSELKTDWVCIATAGKTIDGREIKPEWLTQMAATYNKEFYTACLWPDHYRVKSLGSVDALKSEVVNGIVKLFAIIKPSLELITYNKASRYMFCSIEPEPDFAGTGKWYLPALGVTDEPASVGTTHMKFSKNNALIGQSQCWTNKAETYMKNQPISYTDLINNISILSMQVADKEFRIDPTGSGLLRSAIVQATPMLELLTFLDVDDHTAPLFDPMTDGLRSGRKDGERFIVPARPSQRDLTFHEIDSSAVWTWRQLAQMLSGLSQTQANELLESLALAAFGDDLLRVGFHGQFAADNTDPVANPNGEDVMPGWHAIALAADPGGERVVRSAVTFDTKGTGDYVDLDTMAYALIAKLPAAYRNDPRLRVMVGGELLRAHKQAYLQPGQVRSKDQQMKIADMPVLSHQRMPGNYLAVTFPENLQIISASHTHRLNADELGDINSWGLRYIRSQTYELGDKTAYAAFDDISITTKE
ncbi:MULTISPECIES: GPO family capsid scaffolding protein [Aeromonas]|uniref:GPO family capsid scaffolding protein n=1 Tax=Aeromonas TaxID=642 RepID=UPI0022DF7BCC|nr:GPO family capsid scaffolding protein [Aeromonas sp. Y318-1]